MSSSVHDLTLRFAFLERNDSGEDEEIIVKTLIFSSETSVLEVCADLRERFADLPVRGDHFGEPTNSNTFGLFIRAKDSSKGFWLDPDRTLQHYLLRDNDLLEYRRKLRVLKISLMDGSVKTLMVDDSQVISNLMPIICTKIGILNHDEFSLVMDKPTTGENPLPAPSANRFGTLTLRRSKLKDGEHKFDPKMEEMKRQLKTEDGINWVDMNKTLHEQGITHTDTLLLKRKYFYSDGKVDSRDPVQLNLLYEQVRKSIIDGTHPVPQDNAIEFASIQAQIQFGDHNIATHKVGIMDLKDFLPVSYLKQRNIEKRILNKHKMLTGVSAIDAKIMYVKRARELPSFGVHFFLVKEKMPGKNRMAPRLLGVTKDAVLRLDERSKDILKTWPLTTVRRWAASANVFTLDFGDYQDNYYSVQTTQGEHICMLISGYIDIMLKRREKKDRFGDDGNEKEAIEEDLVTPGRAITMVGLPGNVVKKVTEDSIAKVGTIRNNGTSSVVDHGSFNQSSTVQITKQTLVKDGGHAFPASNQLDVSEPQRALISTICHGQESINRTKEILKEKEALPTLGNDSASFRWKERQKNSSRQCIHSQVSAMNAATARMVTLSGRGDDTDHHAMGAAVSTISSSLPEMAKEVKMLAAIMDDEGASGDDLMVAAQKMCIAFSELLSATDPKSNKSHQTVLSAASMVGSAAHRVLVHIGGEEDSQEKKRRDVLLSLAKAVANTTAALIIKAKNVASKCDDQQRQNKVIAAATHCASDTSQLVACSKVVAPTIDDINCQERLVEAAHDVARSVDNCISVCDSVSQDIQSMKELDQSASDVTRTLNDLLAHVKGSAEDDIPDIMNLITVASDQLISTYDSTEMVRQAKILAESTAMLIRAIKGEATAYGGTDVQTRLLLAAKDLSEATSQMVKAAKQCESSPSGHSEQNSLKAAAESLRTATNAAVGTTLRGKMVKRLEIACKQAAATGTQCIGASQGSGEYNTNSLAHDELMSCCQDVADAIPRVVEAVKLSMINPDSAIAQWNLINFAEQFLEPSIRLTQSCRSALPTVDNQSSNRSLSTTAKQFEIAVNELDAVLSRANELCDSLEIEASADLITGLEQDLTDFRKEADSQILKPLPGEDIHSASLQLNTTRTCVSKNMSQLISAAYLGEQDMTNRAAQATANALREFTIAVRGVAASTKDKRVQKCILDRAQLVMQKSALLVLEAQRAMVNYNEARRHDVLGGACREVTLALDETVELLPGQRELQQSIDAVNSWTERLSKNVHGIEFLKSNGQLKGDLHLGLSNAADELNNATSNVVNKADEADELAHSSSQFKEALEKLLNFSVEIAIGSENVESRQNMTRSMISVTTSSSKLLSCAKVVTSEAPNAKTNLSYAARDVTENINNLINVYALSSPGQVICDNAIRAIQSSSQFLENPIQPINKMSYFECLDIIKEKSTALGDGMTGMAQLDKKFESEKFSEAINIIAEAISGLIEAAGQSAYLVGASHASSIGARQGTLNQHKFVDASQVIQAACLKLINPEITQAQVLKVAKIIAEQTNAICVECRHESSKTTNSSTRMFFVHSAKNIAYATSSLVDRLKQIDKMDSFKDSQPIIKATKSLTATLDDLCQFINSPEYTSRSVKITMEGKKAQQPIIRAGRNIIEGSCAMLNASRCLSINSNDPPMWQDLSNSSKAVSDAIKALVSSIREKAPGLLECEEALDKLTSNIRELDQASLAAINKNFVQQRDKDINLLLEQIENCTTQISQKMPQVRTAAKFRAEHLGQSVTSMVSYFAPLINNAVAYASNMVNSKQQILILDRTKAIVEGVQQLLESCKEAGGNAKATQMHTDIDESVDAVDSYIQDLFECLDKIAPNYGNMSRIVNCITEAIHHVDDYRKSGSDSSRVDGGGSMDFVTFQTRMIHSCKDIARTAQDIIIKSSNDADSLGNLTSHISKCYQELTVNAVGAGNHAHSNEIGRKIRDGVHDLGIVLISLVTATGSCQMSPNDNFALKDVSENARAVGEKCAIIMSVLNDASTGTLELENASATVSGIIGDLDTTIMFASAGTLNPDTDSDNELFFGHRENIMNKAKALVEDTKALVVGAASSQEQLAVAARNSVSTIVELSEAVKAGACSLGSANREAQVVLINSVRDVVKALSDLMQSTKAASGKKMEDPDMNYLKDSAKMMVTNVTSLLKIVKSVEDEHTRGTRALESSIEAIAQEIQAFDSKKVPLVNAEPEDLIKAARPITLATSKAVSAGNSCRQEDVIVAANMGRKAITDMLVTCKAAAYGSDKTKAREQTLQSGREVAKQYRKLLQMVLQNLAHTPSTKRDELIEISRKLAKSVTDMAYNARLLKDDDWVDPADPTVIAENELLGAARSIEVAASKLAELKPRKEIKGKEIETDLNFHELIIDAAKSIAAATAALIKAASEAQKELVQQGRVRRHSTVNSEEGQWSEGLVSAARHVAAATHNLCEAANTLVKEHTGEEKLISAAKQIASSTAQLLLSCKVKADANSATMRRLEDASNAVRKATERLVEASQKALDREEEQRAMNEEDLNRSTVNSVVQEINARSDILRMERQLSVARGRLEKIHQRRYQTESDTDHSGYESSGNEPISHETSYNYGSNVYSQLSSSKQIYPNVSGNSIDAGPSFNQSMQHFRRSSPSTNQNATNVFVQPIERQQISIHKTSSVNRAAVEEQRFAAISKKKSYRIE